MDAIIRECVIYLFFVLVVYFISFMDRDKRSFNFTQNIKNQFFGGNNPFNQIQTYEDVYGWVNGTLFPNLYSYGWYNGEPPSSWRDMQQMNDHVTIRLGIGRLRQLRIKENTCTIQKSLRSLIHHCRNDYNWMDDDAKSYAFNWMPLSSQNLSEVCLQYQKPFDPWRYRNTIELRGSPYVGAVNTYKGGGYTFNFRRDGHATQTKFNELAQSNWLDVRTRALFVEFTLYNGNSNLFASVIMLIEFLATGGPVFTQEVKVFRLSSYVGPFGIIVILFQVIFVGFIVYFMYHIVSLIRKQKFQFFKSFWNCLEFCTIIMSIIAIAMYGMKMIMGNTAMNVLKEAGTGEYVNFVTIATWAEMFSFMLAFVVFLATLKFIKMLKFNRRMAMLAHTIGVATKDMRAFVFTFFIYFFAFVMFAYLLFSVQLPAYSSVIATIESLFQFFVGSFDYVGFTTAQPVLGPIFFFLFVGVAIFGLQAMFLTIICEAFQLVRSQAEFQKSDYEVVDYILGKFKGVLSIITGDRYDNGRNSSADGRVHGQANMAAPRSRRGDGEVGDGNVEIGFE